MAYAHTNRKGVTYYLHRRERKGRPRYVFCRAPGEGAVDVIPEGYEVRESMNGQVSLAKARPRLITPAEEAVVRRALPAQCRLEVKGRLITIYEPNSGPAELMQTADPWLRRALSKHIERFTRFEPVMRLRLEDDELRLFEVTRMHFSGEGGWTYPLGMGSIDEMSRKFVPHVGRDSFFELY